MIRRLTIVALGAALILGACASVARVVYPVNTDAARAKPGDYALDPDHASVIFGVDHLGFSTYYGRFNEISGRLSIDPAAPEAAEAAILIKAASVDTPSAALNDKLRAAFGAEAHPDILFVSTRISRTGEATADIEGALTLRGRTGPVTLRARFHGSGRAPIINDERMGFDASAVIRRSDWGVDDWKGFVGDEVSLIISAEFIRVD